SPVVIKAKDYIDTGGIGDVLTVRSREAHAGPHEAWFWDKELSGGGAMLDMGCHTIEAARYFLGKENKVVEVLAWAGRMYHREEMRHFIECVATGKMPRENFEDGYVVNCILDAAYASVQSKRWESVSY